MGEQAKRVLLLVILGLGTFITFYGAFHTQNVYKIDALTAPMTYPITPYPLCPLTHQGDADCNGRIELRDFEIFRKEYTGEETTLYADFTRDGDVELSDFEVWRKGYFL